MFRNGSQFYRNNTRTETALTFRGRATFEFLEGTRFKFGYGQHGGSAGGNPCAVRPDEDGHVSLIFDGAVWEVFRSSGGNGISGSNGKGVVEVRGECLREITYHPGWNWRDPFIDQKEVRLDDGAALTVVVGPYRGRDGSDQEGRQLPATVSQRVPFTGAGSFCFSNATPATARAYRIRCSDNAATGTVSAAGANASLQFDDGANWAGTVVADGNVVLAGADSGEPAEVSFGGLECRRDFPVRVWGEGTRTFAKTGAKNDRIHFGETGFLARGGILVVDPRDGCEPDPGAKWYLGTIAAGAPGPEPDGDWRIVRKPSADAGVDDLWLAFGKRTMLILR